VTLTQVTPGTACVTTANKDSEARDISATPVNPPVVLSKGRVSLADHLDLRNLPLATTPGGTNFALKALHPSEHTIKTARVPGGNMNSTALCCDMVETIPLSANGNNYCDISVWAQPLAPASVQWGHVVGGVKTSDGYGSFMNAAFGGTFTLAPTPPYWNQLNDTFCQGVDGYRVVSQSVTAELIAPALSDQGTITAFQYNPGLRTAQMSVSDSTNRYLVRSDLYVYEEPPQIAQGLMGTNGYTAKAREGVYLPLKITGFKWKTTRDVTQYGPAQAYAALMSTANPLSIGAPIFFPYTCNRGAVSLPIDWEVMPKPCSKSIGVIRIEGCAADVAIRIRVRQVLEIVARPGSVYAPLMEAALPPDPTSLKMYAEISARMADGYPASYNDLGKLKDLILGIGKKVLPYVEPGLDMLSKMPGPVGTVASVAKQAVPLVKTGAGVVKTIVAARKASKGKKASSQGR